MPLATPPPAGACFLCSPPDPPDPLEPLSQTRAVLEGVGVAIAIDREDRCWTGALGAQRPDGLGRDSCSGLRYGDECAVRVRGERGVADAGAGIKRHAAAALSHP